MIDLLNEQLKFNSVNLVLCGGDKEDTFSPILSIIDVKGDDIFDGVFHIHYIDKNFNFES